MKANIPASNLSLYRLTKLYTYFLQSLACDSWDLQFNAMQVKLPTPYCYKGTGPPIPETSGEIHSLGGGGGGGGGDNSLLGHNKVWKGIEEQLGL